MGLRQWLYRNGDQCLHNTGGWMQCSVEGTPYTGQYVFHGQENYYGRVSSPGVMDSAVSFADNSIIFNHHITATADFSGYGNASGQRVYSRGGGMANANAGTMKPLPISISKYSSLKIVTDDSDFTESIRVGVKNDENTSVSTATVLQSGVGNMDISLGDEHPYFVVKSSSEQNAVNATTSTASLNYSHSCSVSEIYLV